MRGLQRMTVRTEDPQVHEAIVGAITVRVIELDWNDTVVRSTFSPTAQLAGFLLQAFANQSPFQVV